MTTTHDIVIDGVVYITQITLADNGLSTISMTEACEHADDGETHEHTIYDFKEIE